MGCDIHMWAEIKQKYPNPDYEAPWEAVGRVFESPYYDKDRVPTISWSKDGEWERNEQYTTEPFGGRNYALFSILSNVRNGYGFAGVDTGDGFVPISMPKGVPKDASDHYRHQVEYWDSDGHSHSYLSLADLDAYNWNQLTVRRGVVHQEGYRQFKANGKPDSWAGDISGLSIQKVSNQEMEKHLNEDHPNMVTRVEWTETYADCCRYFLDTTLPKLREIAAMENILDLRIVFFFDN